MKVNVNVKTDRKCSGCKQEMPKLNYNVETRRATWFGTYKGADLMDWVCVDCWDKGLRYNKELKEFDEMAR